MPISSPSEAFAAFPNTDKDTAHSYGAFYDALFANCGVRGTILEIGIDKGDSLRAWRAVGFDLVVGIDFDHSKLFSTADGGIRCHWADQRKIGSLFNIVKLYSDLPGQKSSGDGCFDVIVDDGSHILSETVLTFSALYPALKRGGKYVIEDVQDISCWLAAFEYLPFQVHDRRDMKNRHDDVLFVFTKP